MLAGLIFATEEADDRPDTLSATLPFGGMTLLEYQVRLLVGAGAGQVLVAVQRVTPALLGAISRAARRGVPVDVVRSAAEAVAKVHPLARVLVLADSLVTTDPVIDKMASDTGEAILVTKAGPAALERLDAAHCWAGIARVPANRLAELARLPADYDFQSTLLRLVVQAGPDYVQLAPAAARAGHGVERHAEALASRSNAVLAALTERRSSWADRWVFTRFARWALPKIVARNVPAGALPIAGGVLGVGALAAIWAGWAVIGLPVALLAVAAFSTGGALSVLRGEDARVRLSEQGIMAVAALSVLVLGLVHAIDYGTGTGPALALSLVAALVIAERAVRLHKRWWASPGAVLIVLTPFVAFGQPLLGLAGTLAYVFATLAAAVESAREKA